MDRLMTPQESSALLDRYRSDFERTVRTVLPGHLFSVRTPARVRRRLIRELSSQSRDLAVSAIEPLYETDLPSLARRVTVPVVSINSDFTESAEESGALRLKPAQLPHRH